MSRAIIILTAVSAAVAGWTFGTMVVELADLAGRLQAGAPV